MQENTPLLSRTGNYVPTGWTRFLWWLSTAEEPLLKDCAVDRNRYSIVGMTVLATWAFATLAWAYFFSTVINSLPAIILLGLFMGGIILTIDRALIKGINRIQKRKYAPLALRGFLALTIGLFMAQPALLFLFDKEIHVQISLDNEIRKKEKKQKQDSLYAADKTALLLNRNQLQQQLSSRYDAVSAARESFIRETDGTGGSKKIGLKDIAKAKQDEYQKLDADYRQLTTDLLPQIKKADSSLAAIEQAIQREQQVFNGLLNDGFLSRIEAMNHLVRDNAAVAFRYYLLVALLMLIELMPVLAKMLLPDGSYEEKVRLQEQLEMTLNQKNHERELALKELYNQTAFEQDATFIREFFYEAEHPRKEKMKETMQEWRDTRSASFDSVWDAVKKDMLTKQEN